MSVYRAAVRQRLDERIIVVRHLLIIGAQEAQRLVIVVSLGVVPRHRLMANIGEVLPCRGAQQLQEGHLHCIDGVFFHINVVQLWADGEKHKRREKGLDERRSKEG